MEGRSDILVRELQERMESAANRLDFENAARYRDQLQSIERIADRQKVLTRGRDDQDIVAYARSGNDVFVEVAYVRQGKMVGHDGHALDGAGDAAEPEVLRGFMLQYYSSATHVPRSVILPGPVEEPELITGWLSERRGRPVTLEVPQRGRKRALVIQLEEADIVGDRSFTSRPDLILIDGGKGQLSAALEVMEAAGYADIPTFALAKEREEIFAPGRAEPIVQERNSPGMFLVQRIRDEAHRFAITHHRKVRARKALTSPLDSVEGIGPARKRALLRHFGSVQAIREAPVDEIVKLGIPERLAARLKETL